jgi:lipoprotein-anchoring transpeptidase ErfK/SrfK
VASNIEKGFRVVKLGMAGLLTKTDWLLCLGAIIFCVSVRECKAEASVVALKIHAAPGAVVVRTKERKLYFILDSGRALRYPIGVGRAGRQWAGDSVIEGKYVWPNWAPPLAIRHDRPNLPEIVPSGAPNNPMGAAALTLSGGNYAIHGTNSPTSIGGFVSYGCIRMYNSDIEDLYRRVQVGTRVIVTR